MLKEVAIVLKMASKSSKNIEEYVKGMLRDVATAFIPKEASKAFLFLEHEPVAKQRITALCYLLVYTVQHHRDLVDKDIEAAMKEVNAPRAITEYARKLVREGGDTWSEDAESRVGTEVLNAIAQDIAYYRAPSDTELGTETAADIPHLYRVLKKLIPA